MTEGLLDDTIHSGLDPEKPYGIAYFGRTRSSYVSTRSKKRKVEPVPRSEWITVPVSLEGSGLERAKVERSRAAIADNRVPPKVGDYEYELSRGFLFCASCGRAMTATTRRFRERGTAYHYYYCPKNRQARGMLPECPNRKSLPAVVLEHDAALLFEESASQETLLELYDMALEQQNGSGNASRTRERRAALSERLSALAAMCDKFQRQEAEDLMTLDELRERLAEIEEQKNAPHRGTEGCGGRGCGLAPDRGGARIDIELQPGARRMVRGPRRGDARGGANPCRRPGG